MLFRRLDRLMAEENRNGLHVDSLFKETDRERIPKAMGMAALNARDLEDLFEPILPPRRGMANFACP